MQESKILIRLYQLINLQLVELQDQIQLRILAHLHLFRELYSNTELSKERGYTPGQFSFNVAVGRCFACEGDGVKKIEMQFLSDVYVRCDECNGKRYNSETLGSNVQRKKYCRYFRNDCRRSIGIF